MDGVGETAKANLVSGPDFVSFVDLKDEGSCQILNCCQEMRIIGSEPRRWDETLLD